MIHYFQPIGCIDPNYDGWGFAPLTGNETSEVDAGPMYSGGPHTPVWPLLDVDEGAFVGHLQPTFGDDFYRRIHLSIVELNVGNVISLQEHVFTLWNAWFHERTLLSVVAANNTGITILGLPATPASFPALNFGEYTILLDTDGPPTIDATYTFTFTGGETLVLHIVGRRVIVFPFPPNWGETVNETLEWRTDVLRSYNGKEQRRGLRVIPRRGFEYSLMVQDRDADRMETILWGWSIRDFVVPVWTDGSRTTAMTPQGATLIQLDTTDRSFNVGDYVVLFNSSTSYEAAEVESFDGTSVTIVSPLQTNWPQGTKVYPAVVARLPETIPTQRHSNKVLTGRMVFSMRPEATYPFLPDVTPTVTYEGLEVVTTPLNWKGPINNDFTKQVLTADAGVGAISYFAKDSNMRMVRPFEWVLKTRAEIVAFRAFIARLRGQINACWIPSWHGDFTMVGITGPSSESLEVDGTEFASLIGVDSSRSRLRIRMNDGTIFYRTIEGVTQLATTTLLGVNAAFGITLDPTNVRSIDLLLRCRLMHDKVDIPWLTDSVATPQLTFTTVDA